METISAQNIKTNMLEGQKWFGMAPIALVRVLPSKYDNGECKKKILEGQRWRGMAPSAQVRVLPSKYDNGERKNMKTVSAKILKQIC